MTSIQTNLDSPPSSILPRKRQLRETTLNATKRQKRAVPTPQLSDIYKVPGGRKIRWFNLSEWLNENFDIGSDDPQAFSTALKTAAENLRNREKTSQTSFSDRLKKLQDSLTAVPWGNKPGINHWQAWLDRDKKTSLHISLLRTEYRSNTFSRQALEKLHPEIQDAPYFWEIQVYRYETQLESPILTFSFNPEGTVGELQYVAGDPPVSGTDMMALYSFLEAQLFAHRTENCQVYTFDAATLPDDTELRVVKPFFNSNGFTWYEDFQFQFLTAYDCEFPYEENGKAPPRLSQDGTLRRAAFKYLSQFPISEQLKKFDSEAADLCHAFPEAKTLGDLGLKLNKARSQNPELYKANAPKFSALLTPFETIDSSYQSEEDLRFFEFAKRILTWTQTMVKTDFSGTPNAAQSPDFQARLTALGLEKRLPQQDGFMAALMSNYRRLLSSGIRA